MERFKVGDYLFEINFYSEESDFSIEEAILKVKSIGSDHYLISFWNNKWVVETNITIDAVHHIYRLATEAEKVLYATF
jgi:hypothetical protein